MHVLNRKIFKKCGKDICGSELYTLVDLVVSFCSKHNIFSKIITKIGLLKQNPPKNVNKYRAVVILLLLTEAVKGLRLQTSDFRLQTLVPSFANSQHCFCVPLRITLFLLYFLLYTVNYLFKCICRLRNIK